MLFSLGSAKYLSKWEHRLDMLFTSNNYDRIKDAEKKPDYISITARVKFVYVL